MGSASGSEIGEKRPSGPSRTPRSVARSFCIEAFHHHLCTILDTDHEKEEWIYICGDVSGN